jgi:hypothetical protein
VKNLGRLGSGGAGDSGLEKQSFPRALPDTLDRILGKLFTVYSPLIALAGPVCCVDPHWIQSVLRFRIRRADPYVFGPPGSVSDPLVRGMFPDPDPSIIKQK